MTSRGRRYRVKHWIYDQRRRIANAWHGFAMTVYEWIWP